MLAFEDGAAASLVYSGYDFFDSDEWHGWINERGAVKGACHGAARRALAQGHDETRLRTDNYAYGAPASMPAHQPHFGLTIVTCARGDMRASADGLVIYDAGGMREVAIPRGAGLPGRREVLDDMRAALRSGGGRCMTGAGARPIWRSRSRCCTQRARGGRSRWSIRWRCRNPH